MCRIRTILKDNLFFLHVLPIAALPLFFCLVSFESRAEPPAPRREIPRDGSWHIATDPENDGRNEHWFSAIRPEAKETRVPWIIQQPFPGYHGVAWYWHTFIAPALDDSRMVLLNSGRWDNLNDVPLTGLRFWQNPNRTEPCVTFNATDHALSGYGITWQPGQMALHPGPNGEYSVVRWTAPVGGKAVIHAVFSIIAERATTDVHVLHNGTPLFDALINLEGGGPAAEHRAEAELSTGDTVDFVVGWGNGDYGADTTALAASVTMAPGETFDAAKAFSIAANPTGPWSYGMLAPSPAPDTAALTLYTVGDQYDDSLSIGSLSNPGSDAWEDVLHDQHRYPRVPHTGDIIRSLREYRGGGHPAGMGEGGYSPEAPDAPPEPPVFPAEYGIGSAADLARVVRLYEQLAAAAGYEAVFFVSTPYEAPGTEGGAAVWSDDPALRDWLAAHGVDVAPFNADSPAKAIIVSHTPGPGPLDEAWAALHNAIQTGSTAVFRNGDDPVARLPLEQRGHLKAIGGWLYLKDEWAKDHPVFDGLPDGGLLDYRFYREIIPDLVFADFPPPREAIAGAITTSQAYDSGLLTAVYDVGEGKIVLNTLRIREFLGQHPVADRLLINVVRFAQEGAHDE